MDNGIVLSNVLLFNFYVMSKKKKISFGSLLSSGILTSSGSSDYNDIVVPKTTLQPIIENRIEQDIDVAEIKTFDNAKYSGLKLFKFDHEELPKLIEPIFPKVGIVSLVGSSDTGKSTFLRQLALSVALGFGDFIGYTISASNRNVIYISTEDDPASTSISLKKQIKGLYGGNQVSESSLNHLKFIFDFNLNEDNDENLFNILEKDLAETKVDLIVVDAFTDIFSGDINSSTKVREFLNYFSKLAKDNNCLILFLHHTGKRTDKYTASKDNVLGSQAFEAKMRVLIELKQYPNEDSKRTLTITKGNYISSQIKKQSKVLRFDEDKLLFFNEGQILTSSIATLGKTYSKKEEVLPIIKKLHSEKKSVREIESTLKSKGHSIGKSTVSNYINEIKSKTPNIIE